MKKIIPLIALMTLSACAPSISGSEMVPGNNIFSQINAGKYKNAIQLGNIEVKDDSLGYGANVNADAYKSALSTSLINAGLSNNNSGLYKLDALLYEVDAPLSLLDLTVTSKAKYTLKNIRTGAVVYSQDLTLPCTVRFAEVPDGTLRMQKATACSVQENISHFLRTVTR